jgi:hypothetical protein
MMAAPGFDTFYICSQLQQLPLAALRHSQASMLQNFEMLRTCVVCVDHSVLASASRVWSDPPYQSLGTR